MSEPLLVYDPQPIHILLLVFGLFTIVFATFGRVLKEKLFLTEPLCATCIGIFIAAADVGIEARLDPVNNETTRTILLEMTRLTIVVQVMTTALELPTGLVVRQWWPLLLLLGPVLAAGWWLAMLLVWGIMGFEWKVACLVGACVTATDPVLAHAIVQGTFAETLLPGRLRDLMSAESAANDGFAYPFVMLPILLLTKPANGHLAAEYLVSVWLYEIITGCVICALIGWVSGTVLKWADRRGYVENTSLIGYSIVLALSVLGAGRCLNINEVLGSFVAGVTFASALDARDRIAELQIQETADLLLGNLFFLAFGASIPWDSWGAMGFGAGQMIGVAFAVLCLKRLPVLLAVYKLMPGGLHTLAEAAHFGWFGPVGVAAFFYALEVIESVDYATGERCYVLLTWLIFASIIIHGVSGVPLTKLLSPGMDLSEEHAREAAEKAAAEAAAEAEAEAAPGLGGAGALKEPVGSGESSSGEVAVQMNIAAAGAGAAAAGAEGAKPAAGVQSWLRRMAAAVGCGAPEPPVPGARGLTTAGAAGGSSRYALAASASLRPGAPGAGVGGITARTSFAPRRYRQLAAASAPLPGAAVGNGGGGGGVYGRIGSQQHGAGGASARRQCSGRAAGAPAEGGVDVEAPPPPPLPPPQQQQSGEAELVPARG
ncbi:hypothetical protein HYH02_007212 [Chlamydomonas schloesseri]|uniref:Cation/H+ exchanger transmembrane domain-containing protein n=1 Tax=Chlamydomonas schloesseri TaxID=2026947 RepID=A0A835WIA0_9CHLO|nr:hypothetical protein HYH02_007212 [Chlamydomonas schloesseri]|eukprot:KAG2447754.1 hypothetical protein HYH02_007212 [Chlamydomonas schloesseri]